MAQLFRINMISMAGLVLIIGGIIGIGLGGFLYLTANAGLDSLQTVYETQGRFMTYDDDGNFTDRGTKEAGGAILRSSKMTGTSRSTGPILTRMTRW